MSRELQARYDSRKSFYGKATILNHGEKLILVSYTTQVATIENGVAVVHGTHGVTTLRHIKEFLLQNGFKADSKKQIENDYMGGVSI